MRADLDRILSQSRRQVMTDAAGLVGLAFLLLALFSLPAAF
jgi:hypothetical protein